MADAYDFTAPGSNWLVRAYYTPVSDALRGRLSARLDVRRAIASAGLPAPLSGLIYIAVRRSRLWNGEMHDVAQELIAHFADGLSAGRSAEELARDFGSPEQAAKLIRKAKLRSRSPLWRCYHVLIRLFVLGVTIGVVDYSLLAARFYLSRPNIAHNYWQDINAARRVAEADRAWPLYRAAALKLDKSVFADEWLLDGPGSDHWAAVVASLERHRESLDLARQGATRARLGYFAGDPADRKAARAAHADWLMHEGAPLADENRVLYQMLLGGMDALRSLARLLAADAQRAALAGDGALVVANLSALLSMSEQIHQPGTSLVEQLVATAVLDIALETAGQILDQRPQAVMDAQWRDLAHRIAAYRDGALSIDFSMERMGFDDLLQRMYTDDGHGDGHITPAGAVLLHSWTNESPLQAFVPREDHEKRVAALLLLIGPGVATLIGGRLENHNLYESVADESVRAHQGFPWQWDRKTIAAIEDRLRDHALHPTQKLRYLPALSWCPAFDGAYNGIERAIQRRDAIEVAIALELWRRRHGGWPTSLDQLVPDLLPAVPPDRYDGRPLRYVVRDGRPVIYSVGNDRKDDGGRPTAPLDWAFSGGYGRLTPEALKSLQQLGANGGDWLLWPPVKEQRQ